MAFGKGGSIAAAKEGLRGGKGGFGGRAKVESAKSAAPKFGRAMGKPAAGRKFGRY